MEDNDALALLQAVYRNPQIPLNTRMRAAKTALPFERPKLSAIAVGTANDLADRLMQALQASAKVINSRPLQVIEHAPKVDAGLSTVEGEPPDHSAPFAQNSKHRFKRF
jgi:hypothetical protein